ncbi:DNA methyltransferase [Gimesia aquarii]|uniref:Methyltransferase n=1 Tax=Gimesia aquarii TaxID=2527964 RepID=A0A517VQR9_9PLAN|nr:DNA methyltransferase [Gimesia aquarii]QDT95290.1 putative methyltransferase [Gimesia aquarii]
MKNTNNNSNRITTHHSTDRSWAIHHGDVNKVLPTLPPVTFDGVFCDPPYGLKFMGHKWDGTIPPTTVFQDLLRLCKPGAYLLVFGHPKTFHRLSCNIEDAGWVLRDVLCWLYGDGFPKGKNIGQTLDERWDDYHTFLKSAWEPIILAMKPVDGTFVKNATNHGCGGLNIGDCRIGTTCCTKRSHQAPYPRLADSIQDSSNSVRTGRSVEEIDKGRYPANLLLDEEAAAILDEQSGNSKSRQSRRRKAGSNVGNCKTLNAFRSRMDVVEGYDDEGGASRFFYCPKVRGKKRQGNAHPTVKPLALCEYLACLILQPEREIPRRLLVPYSGSGSEMIGALSAGWDHVTGIEIDDQFVTTARRRLSEHKDEFVRPA